MNYRHEQKHEINHRDLLILRQRLSAIMKRDTHAINGCYEIRSLYFDDYKDKALYEKKNGVNRREKFRMRLYNHDSSIIHLEKKSKINGLCQKSRTTLSPELATEIICGNYDTLSQSSDPLLQEFYFNLTAKGLRPKTIVDYTREPFVYAPGNVRVTLDYNIRTGLYSTDFLNPDCLTVPAGDSPIILEVKWDAFLPEIIRDAVNLPNRRSDAFSKYAACRIYN